MKEKCFYIVNLIRLLTALFLMSVCITDLYGIAQDPITYERVYTGEFLGEYQYDTLSQFKMGTIVQLVFISIYVVLVILHTCILKRRIVLWGVRVMDLILSIFIVYSLFGYIIH